MLLFALFLFGFDVLWLLNGETLTCDSFQRVRETVLIRKGREIFSMPSRLVDWGQTAAAAEERRKQAHEPATAEPPPPEEAPEPILPGGADAKLMIDLLDVKDAGLVDLLRFMADMAEVNLIVDNSVPDTKATYFLKNIPWEEALAIILYNANLDYEILYGNLRVGRLR